MARPLPRLRRVEQPRRGAAGDRPSARQGPARPRGAWPWAPRARSSSTSIESGDEPRVGTGIDEFDRVLGGGIVPGSMVLIGGEPGIGKSTLLLQVAHLLGRTHGTVLYVSGEESERQIKLRGERLGIEGGGLFLMAETSLERILEQVEALKPAALVVDSVQTVFSSRRSPRPPAASARCARSRRSCSSWRRAAASRRSSSATSRRTAASPGRSRSSTSWTRSSTSRARSASTTASCARSRTASAPSRSWASSR